MKCHRRVKDDLNFPGFRVASSNYQIRLINSSKHNERNADVIKRYGHSNEVNIPPMHVMGWDTLDGLWTVGLVVNVLGMRGGVN